MATTAGGQGRAGQGTPATGRATAAPSAAVLPKPNGSQQAPRGNSERSSDVSSTANQRPGGAGNAAQKAVRKEEPARRIPKGLEALQERWDFYRDAFFEERRSKRFALGIALIAVLLVPTFYYIGRASKESAVIGMSSDGRITRVPELTEVYVSDATVRRFCAEAVQEIGTFAFHDFKLRFNNLQGLFTDKGWRAYNKVVLESKRVDAVREFTQTWATQVVEPCAILDSREKDGRYWWQVLVKVRRAISSGSALGAPKEIPIKMEIVRVGFAEAKEMIAIDVYREP